MRRERGITSRTGAVRGVKEIDQLGDEEAEESLREEETDRAGDRLREQSR